MGTLQGHPPPRCPPQTYVAERVRPMPGRVDVTRRGRAVPFCRRRVGDDGRLPGVAGAHPDRCEAGEAAGGQQHPPRREAELRHRSASVQPLTPRAKAQTSRESCPLVQNPSTTRAKAQIPFKTPAPPQLAVQNLNPGTTQAVPMQKPRSYSKPQHAPLKTPTCCTKLKPVQKPGTLHAKTLTLFKTPASPMQNPGVLCKTQTCAKPKPMQNPKAVQNPSTNHARPSPLCQTLDATDNTHLASRFPP